MFGLPPQEAAAVLRETVMGWVKERKREEEVRQDALVFLTDSILAGSPGK